MTNKNNKVSDEKFIKKSFWVIIIRCKDKIVNKLYASVKRKEDCNYPGIIWEGGQYRIIKFYDKESAELFMELYQHNWTHLAEIVKFDVECHMNGDEAFVPMESMGENKE